VKTSGQLVIWSDRCRGCRSCQLACSFVRTGEYNPTSSCIALERDLQTEKTAPLVHTLCCDLCSGHPACAEACAYGAILYEPADKPAIRYHRGNGA